MVDNNIKLTVYHDANTVFTDLSKECLDFSRDTVSVTLAASTSYLYVGFRKPINSIYINLDTPNTNACTLSMQFYNGTSWTSLADAQDDTKGLTRSGFITWSRNQLLDSEYTVNSTLKYWVRFQPSVTNSATVVSGISFLFADDQDLKQEVPEIADSNHLAGKVSHVLTHTAVRNQIIQDLRNKDYKHKNLVTGLNEDLTVWDILDANQLKQAAIFLALSKIYFNFSDTTDDKYDQKSKSFEAKYNKALDLARLSIDDNNDGKIDTFEQLKEFSQMRIRR
jgi:hypothetical protein